MKKNVLKGLGAAVLVLTTLSFTTMNKDIKIKESNVTWVGKKVTGSHTGNIKLKDGHLKMDGEKLVGGEFVMDMSSINVTDLSGESKGNLEGHLKSDDFFGVEKFPTSKLVITNVAPKGNGTYAVTGDLTVKNKTNPVNFDMVLNGNTASSKLVIDRSKYDVRYGSGSFFDNLGDKTIYDNFDLDVQLTY